MPLPNPRKDESQNEFISRCMGSETMKNEYSDQKQRTAVCYSQWRSRQNNATIAHLYHNMSQLVHRETMDDKEYLVAPTVMIVAGVLNNIYYPDEEIAQCPDHWNGRPVLVDHSIDKQGNPKTGNDPEEREKRTVGWVFNVRYENKRLKAEVWIDKEKCNQVENGSKVLRKLESNQPIEVSTCLYTVDVGKKGIYNGEHYNSIATELRGDHLALLPNDVGACSWDDGAGLPRINKRGKSMEMNIRGTARTPEYEGVSSGEWNAPDMKAMINGYYKHHSDTDKDSNGGVSTVGQMPASMKKWIAAKSLLGDSTADTYEELVYFPVVNPSTNKLNENGLRAVTGGRGAQADISDKARKSARRKAYHLLNDEFDAGLDIPEELKADSEKSKYEHFINRQKEVGINANEKGVQAIFQELLGQLEDKYESGLEEKTVEIEDIYPESKFIIFEVSGIQYNSSYFRQEYQNDNDMIILVDEPEEVEKKTEFVAKQQQKENNKMDREAVVKYLIENSEDFTEESRRELEELSDNILSKLKSNVEALANTGEEDPSGRESPNDNNQEPSKNGEKAEEAGDDKEPSVRFNSVEDFLGAIPEGEIKDSLVESVAMRNNEKENLVTRLLNNENCEYSKNELEAKPLTELKRIAKLARIPNFAGNAGGPVSTKKRKGAVPMPTINWEEKGKIEKAEED